MRQVNALRLALLLTCWFWVDSVWAVDPPVRVVLIESNPDKGGLTDNKIRLSLVNEEDHSVWYILPYIVDPAKQMPASGVFSYKNWKPTPGWGDGRFGGSPVRAEQGWAVEVRIQNEDFVTAFHLPAKRQIVLANYRIWAHGRLKRIEVLEVREPKVNGTTPLEKWLPYDTMSGDKEPVDSVGSSENLDWDKKRDHPRDDYPKEIVKNVVATGIRHWDVAVRPTDDKKTP